VAVEGLSVCEVRVGLAGVGGGVELGDVLAVNVLDDLGYLLASACQISFC
jgi:hypothetical protein